MAVINSSGWPLDRPITLETKSDLLQGLIIEEVLRKRITPLNCFRRGLSSLGLLQLMMSQPDTFQPILVHSRAPLTAATFAPLIAPEKPGDGGER